MAKFKEGDRVKVVQLTDVDNPSRAYTTNAAAIRAFGNEMGPLIGDVVVVVIPARDDNYEVLVAYRGETYAVSDADLFLVDGGQE